MVKVKVQQDEIKRLRAQLEMQAKIIQNKDDELQEKYDNVVDLRMKMDDLKMELREESTKSSKYLQSANRMQMQYENEKCKAAQYENELILLKCNLDPNFQAAATSIGVSIQQPSLYIASTFASSINTLAMSTANTAYVPTFV